MHLTEKKRVIVCLYELQAVIYILGKWQWI